MSLTVKTPQRPFFLHDLRPSPEAEAELEWLFNRAEIEIGTPSSWHALVENSLAGRRGGHVFHDAERHADALHNAHKIVGWLEAMPRPLADILVAAHRPCMWPERVELKFGRVTGVVMTLPQVVACWSRAAKRSGRSIAEWLDAQLARDDDTLADAALAEATGLYAHAIRAYCGVHGDKPFLFEGEGGAP